MNILHDKRIAVRDCQGMYMYVNMRNKFCILYSVYDVPFLRHVTSNKTYDFCMFYKFFNLVPIDLTIGTHIDWTYMYTYVHCKNIHQ